MMLFAPVVTLFLGAAATLEPANERMFDLTAGRLVDAYIHRGDTKQRVKIDAQRMEAIKRIIITRKPNDHVYQLALKEYMRTTGETT